MSGPYIIDNMRVKAGMYEFKIIPNTCFCIFDKDEMREIHKKMNDAFSFLGEGDISIYYNEKDHDIRTEKDGSAIHLECSPREKKPLGGEQP